MPSATESPLIGGNDAARPRATRLKYAGSLEKYTYADVTPVIGRQFEDLQVRELLKADDQVYRDLALTSGLHHAGSGHDIVHMERLTLCQFLSGASSSFAIRT
jgi:hypothetical protein